jgi:hypothetical protein
LWATAGLKQLVVTETVAKAVNFISARALKIKKTNSEFSEGGGLSVIRMLLMSEELYDVVWICILMSQDPHNMQFPKLSDL